MAQRDATEQAKPAAATADTPLADRWNNRTLFRLIWPLVIEQILAVSIGMADTVMVAGVGESAVSGVSLVDAINILLITVLTSLATGGAVVASQYLGRGDRKSASMASRQLVYTITALALFIMVLVLILRRPFLHLVYGSIAGDVMAHAESYLWISAISYPFIALYNACAAIFRSMGNSKVGMLVAFVVNLINIGGNALFIYVFNMGVAGAALSTLISRAVAAVILIRMLLHIHVGPITLAGLFSFHISTVMIRQILRIGLPNGLENSMFQIGKLMVSRIVSTFGTAAIAANAIAGSIITVASLPVQAYGLALLTVVGQCVGAKNYPAAKRNTKKLMLLAHLSMALLCLPLFFARGPLLQAFNLSPAAVQIGKDCMAIFFLFAPFLWPPSFALPNALRAAGDARFTMLVSMISMWTIRIGMAYLLAVYFNLGILGVWFAMLADWIPRSICFIARWLSGKWQTKVLLR